MVFSLKGGEGDARVEGLETFWYLGRHLDKTDDDWKAVWQNIMHARSVWVILRTLLRQEGIETRVAEMFYMALVQVILMYDLEMWVLLSEMENKV